MLTASGLLRAASNLRQDQSDNLDSKLEILKVTFFVFFDGVIVDYCNSIDNLESKLKIQKVTHQAARNLDIDS